MNSTTNSKLNPIFWIHLAIMLSAWFLPFLFWWPIVWIIYALVHLQFFVFGRCLMNDLHDLDESDDKILYTDVLETLGFQINRKKVKFFVRGLLYPILGVFAVIWQVVLGFKPLFF